MHDAILATAYMSNLSNLSIEVNFACFENDGPRRVANVPSGQISESGEVPPYFRFVDAGVNVSLFNAFLTRPTMSHQQTLSFGTLAIVHRGVR